MRASASSRASCVTAPRSTARRSHPAQARERIARLYRPYHEALARLIEETRRQFGVAILIDCHSMPSAVSVPDVVLGNRFGASACASLTNLAETSLRDVGFSVARNAPYAGGYTTLLHGQRDSAVHALQIELNRSLYLDEERIELKADFGAIQSRLTEALARLVKVDIAALGSAQQTLAAE
ncbi:MAG: N-formylglutamate amidohydrolase [Rhizomicrobium sp.]